MTSTLRALLAVTCLGVALHPGYGAETSVPASETLRIGMSAALTGPSASLGKQVREGIRAAFDEWNRNGSIPGQKLELIALDDGYEPSRTAPNLHELVEKEKVAALMGCVGAPCAVVAVPIANASKTPLYGYISGGAILRKTPPDRYVVNFRAGLAEETAALVDHFVLDLGVKPEEIACFSQRDTFGDAMYSGVLAALRRHGLRTGTQIVHARYERNTSAVEMGLSELLLASTPIRAVIIASTGTPASLFVKQARAAGLDALFGAVSFADASLLATELGTQGDGMVVSQVVPHFDSDLPIAREYRAALAKSDPNARPSFISFEGYVSARVFQRALGRIDGVPTHDNIVDALLGMGDFAIGLGVPLRLSPTQHQACQSVWLTELRGGKVVSLGGASSR
jgi:branched-chain amino acid transport system substrate-binding protein